MNIVLQVLIECIIIGLATVAVGSLIGFIISKLVKTSLPPECKDWNKFYVMEIALFLTGFCLHLLFELTGLNKKYCDSIFPATRNN